ncbi:hypothetical protein RUMOBE_04064 [Blautia obeum ATCC 29174]|uniref:Uncharacterized protein n=1 Tax=Blautia obeum ATCC 29174 TaxID=411459 RepID=A5ZYF6_9FIRM|nr:hypothetical protein RUMOBE_04064 [Blautia obeum ATCC 29174]
MNYFLSEINIPQIIKKHNKKEVKSFLLCFYKIIILFIIPLCIIIIFNTQTY